eukprot:TRINITY_DN11050_c0_g1_i2.p1 TRINITY_DN11050_c0_g1~~TRINITY_DN11050_c0_g1_i2.p1  ORF type:complete len:230 (-),score=33.53 TRINITY_DN11050_c0_g1_i2:100-717(-)
MGAGDVFDPSAANYGNTNAYCDGDNIKTLNGEKIRAPDWLYLADKEMDLRLLYLECIKGQMHRTVETGECKVHQISGVSFRPICFTTEALKYAQSGFFYAIVWAQVSNAILLKTRFSSLKYQGLRNFFLIFAIFFEICLMLILAYCHPLNLVLGTRDVVWFHLGIFGFPHSIFMLVHDEIRKYLIRNFPKTDPGKPNWFERNSLW